MYIIALDNKIKPSLFILKKDRTLYKNLSLHLLFASNAMQFIFK